VRQLENALERALIVAGDAPIEVQHLALGAAAQRGTPAAELLAEGFDLDGFERDLIRAALERSGGNKTRAAQMLGVTRRRLYSLMASHGLAPAE
jgi:DNA-binding NtrC family response regulator